MASDKVILLIDKNAKSEIVFRFIFFSQMNFIPQIPSRIKPLKHWITCENNI